MEENNVSVVSSSERDEISEPCDLDSIVQPFPASKSTRLGPSSPASRFKGVVLQQNGHWGAQIYANHQRIWLGTFRTEHEAAMAYDSAAIKLRAGDSYRNFPWTSINLAEPEFQNHFSVEAVLGMIRDGTYPFKLAEYVSRCDINQNTRERAPSTATLHENQGVTWRPMFQKELTPSDVGKLNRVVIPKRYALKYFPAISEIAEENTENGQSNANGDNTKDVELVFYDKSMKMWRFRYCYWTSSQSFVLTRGWNRFVKENKLEAKDLIMFFMCEYGENPDEVKSFCVIDVSKAEKNAAMIENPVEHCVLQNLDLELHLGPRKNLGIEEDLVKGDDGDKKSFKLFGVQII